MLANPIQDRVQDLHAGHKVGWDWSQPVTSRRYPGGTTPTDLSVYRGNVFLALCPNSSRPLDAECYVFAVNITRFAQTPYTGSSQKFPSI